MYNTFNIILLPTQEASKHFLQFCILLTEVNNRGQILYYYCIFVTISFCFQKVKESKSARGHAIKRRYYTRNFLKEKKKRGEQYCVSFLRKAPSPGSLRGAHSPHPRVLYKGTRLLPESRTSSTIGGSSNKQT